MAKEYVDPRYIDKAKLYALLERLFAGQSWRAEVSLIQWTEASNFRCVRHQGSKADFVLGSEREVGHRDAHRFIKGRRLSWTIVFHRPYHSPQMLQEELDSVAP